MPVPIYDDLQTSFSVLWIGLHETISTCPFQGDLMSMYEEMRAKNVGGAFVYSVTGVAPDYINAWMWLSVREGIETGPPSADRDYWKEVPHYEEYMRAAKHPYVELTLLDSDPAKVATVNALADEYNGMRAVLQAARNYDKGYEFFQRADLLIRGTSPE